MAKQSPAQQKTVERVMHEFKHGELETRGGRKVKSRKQAVAIALDEAGASKYESPRENKRQFRKTRGKERKGETGMDEAEGRGASRKITGRGASSHAGRGAGGEETRSDLYAKAKQRDIPGRSKMSKSQLARALEK
jgi:hypothetical protein